MNYAFIKNGVCINIAIFSSLEDAINLKPFLECDDIIELPINYGIGDKYENGLWTRVEHTSEEDIQEKQTIEERLTIAEDTINFLLGL